MAWAGRRSLRAVTEEITDPVDAEAPVHQLEVFQVDPATLHTFHRNPRRGDVTALAGSLRRSGQYKPIVVNRGHQTDRPDEVLAGNHTLQAAIELGWQKIAVCYVDVDDEQASEIVLKDNRLHDLGTYDDSELVGLLGELSTLEHTGYGQDDYDFLLRATGALASEATSLFDDEPTRSGGPIEHRNTTHGYVTVSWTITPDERDVVRDAVRAVQKRLGLGTSTEAVVALAREVIAREETPDAGE